MTLPHTEPESPIRAGAWCLVAGALALLLAALVVSPELGSMGGDNAEYVMLARTLRGGEGYVTSWAPGPHTAHTIYPPGMALLLLPFDAGPPRSFLGVHILLAAFGGLGVVLLGLLFWRRGLAPAAAALGAFACSAGIWWLWAAADILSELPFVACCAGALLALEAGLEERDKRRNTNAWIAVAWTCGAFALRSAGLALVLPVAWSLLRAKSLGRARFLGPLVMLLVVAGWFAWVGFAGEGGDYRAAFSAGAAGDQRGLLARTWDQLWTVYVAGTPALVFPHGGAFWRWAGRALCGLALAGWLMGLRRRRLAAGTELFVLVYLAMVCLWTHRDPRFALPLAPFLVLFAAEALQRALSGFERRGHVATAVVVAALALPNLVLYVSQIHPRAHRAMPGETRHHVAGFADSWLWNDTQFSTAAPARASYLGVCDLLRTGVAEGSPDTIVMASNPRVASLFTGLSCVKAPSGTPEELLEHARRKGVGLILVDPFSGEPSPSLRALAASPGTGLLPVLSMPDGTMVLRLP